jgi:hypothetical protein
MTASAAPANPFKYNIRAAGEVDLGRAKPGCRRCNGRGVHGYVTDKQTQARVPIICLCVTRNGGVREPPAMRDLRDLSPAEMGEAIAARIRALPPERLGEALAELQLRAENPDRPPQERAMLRAVLAQLAAPQAPNDTGGA